MQTILGANGTIGSVLAGELTKYTDRVRLVSRNPVKVNPGDELFQADLASPAAAEAAIAGSDVVYLVVGLEYRIKIWEELWPRIMRNVIDACVRHNARLVFFDNVYMYDKNEIGHMTESSVVNPSSKKGAVRKYISEMLLDEVKSGRLLALIARAADFYGPGNEKSLITELVYKKLKNGSSANWFADPGRKHSFTYSPDAARATALLGNTADAFNQVWHLPTDRNTLTGREMISLYARELNAPDKVMVLPLWLIRTLGLFVPVLGEMPEMMYQYDRDYVFDSSKFDSRFDFKTTTYQEGVRETIRLS